MIKTYKPNDTARIEALLFTEENLEEAKQWAGSDLAPTEGSGWMVSTLEGWVSMPFDSYLIQGTNEEFYPCAPDVFVNRWMEV